MSHISTAKLALKGVKESIAVRAFENIAHQYGYSYTRNGTVTAMDRAKVKADNIFQGNGLEKYDGIGVNIKQGEFEMVGEFYGRQSHVNNLKQYIAQGYTAEAYRESMLEMGMEVNISYNQAGEIVLEGEVYN